MIASSRKSLATQTAEICVRFQGRRVRHEYVTMQITFLTRKSALIYRRGIRQRVASLTLDCNGVFAIRAYRPLSRRLDRCDRVIQKESGDPNGGNNLLCVRFHGRRVRHVYVTMQITFLARKSALIYRRGLRQRVVSLTIDCNGVFTIRAYDVR